MLKFCRNALLKGDSTGRTGRFWISALAEFFLIVLGLFLALQIENWNQHRQDRDLEHTMLRDIQVNLSNDLKDANWNFRYISGFKRSNEVVMSYLDGEIPYRDSLEVHFANLIGGAIFDDNPSAYESLKTIGLDLISNDSLRQKLTYLYEARYDYIRNVENAVNEYTNTNMFDNLSKHIRINEMLVSAVPLDREALRESNAFRHSVLINIAMLEYSLFAYDLIIARIEDIIHNIELELKKK